MLEKKQTALQWCRKPQLSETLTVSMVCFSSSCVVFVSSSLCDGRQCKLTPALTPTDSPSAPHATYRVITSVSTTRPLPGTHHTLVSRLQMSSSSAQLPTDFTSLQPIYFPPCSPGLFKAHIRFLSYLRPVMHSASPASVFVYKGCWTAKWFSWIHNWFIHRIPPSKKKKKKNDPEGPATHPFPFTVLPAWRFIYRSAFKDEAEVLGRLVIYFSAHGSRVPGNKMPFMCALCLIQGSKAVHAYIIGGLFLDFFFSSFWQCNSSACWWRIGTIIQRGFSLSTVQSSSHFLHQPDFISLPPLLICSSLLLLLISQDACQL